MPHPKKKTTKAAKNQRRSHCALKKITLTECKKCGKQVKPHYACANCGYYKGIKVIDVLKKLSKKDQKKAEKKNKKNKTKETVNKQ